MIYCVNLHFHYLLPSFYACTGKPTTSIQSVTLGSIFITLGRGYSQLFKQTCKQMVLPSTFCPATKVSGREGVRLLLYNNVYTSFFLIFFHISFILIVLYVIFLWFCLLL